MNGEGKDKKLGKGGRKKRFFKDRLTDISVFFYKIHLATISVLASVAAILIAFVINSFFSTNGNDLGEPLRTLVNNRGIAFFVLFIWIVFCFLIEDRGNHIIKINTLKDTIMEKDRQAEITAGVIASKYGEFAESIHKNNIDKIFDKVIKRNPLLESCQLYEYELLRNKNSIEIKIKFHQGISQENTCINGLLQNYYYIDREIYLDIRKFVKEEITDEDVFLEKILKLIDKINNSSMLEPIKECLKNLLFYLVCEWCQEDIPIPNINDCYKTSILIPTLISKSYLYSYNGLNKDKLDRFYYTTPILLDNEYLLTLSIDGSGVDRQQLEAEVKKIVVMIKQEYNLLKGGVA